MARTHIVVDLSTGQQTEVPYTPEEEAAADAAYEAEQNAAPVLPPPTLYAAAQLTISPGDISGIGVNSRFSAALYLDVGLYYVFFTETQADTNFLAKAYDASARVSVTERATDYIVVTATDVNGDPTDPAEVSIEIIRVG